MICRGLSALLLATAAVSCRSTTTAAPSGPASASAAPILDASVDTRAEPADASAVVAIADAGAEAAVDAATTAAPADMLKVPGGTFTMGADTGGEGDEHPAHPVTLASFWLDRTEVTQTAWDECVEAKACVPPDPGILDTFGGLFKGPHKPVIGISWFAAKDYCTWKGKRLPREAEFERAVRGEDGRRYPWGADEPTHERTVFSTNYTDDVGAHPTGRGPYGHDDLAGNVWEWLADDYDPLAYTRDGASEGRPGTCDEILAAQNKLRAENKQGFTGTNPIPTECEKNIRGGAYNYGGSGLRSTNRIHHPPSFKLRMTGVRCAKDG